MSDDGKSGRIPDTPNDGRSAGAIESAYAPPAAYARCAHRRHRKPPETKTPSTPMIDEGARAASDLSEQSGSSAAAESRIDAWRVAAKPVAPAVCASAEKVSPRMMPYAAHTPRQSAASALGTTHADSLPIAFSHALPSVSASFASHTRAVSEKVYAEITPRPITSAEAGHSAAGTSPIRATPEGSERTPAPSAALQMLNVVVVKLAPSSVEAGGGDAAVSPSSGSGTAAAAQRICGRSDNGRTAALRSCRVGRPAGAKAPAATRRQIIS